MAYLPAACDVLGCHVCAFIYLIRRSIRHDLLQKSAGETVRTTQDVAAVHEAKAEHEDVVSVNDVQKQQDICLTPMPADTTAAQT